MPKTFREFRKNGWSDEWDDDDVRDKERRLQDRRQKRHRRVGEKHSAMEEDDDE